MSKAGRLKQEKKQRREKRKKRKEKEINILERDQKKLRKSAEEDGARLIDRSEFGDAGKISEMVGEMVEPLLENARNEDDIRTIFYLGMLAWNAAIMRAVKGEDYLKAMLSDLYKELGYEISGDINRLIQYKIDNFSEYYEFIVNHTLSVENGQIYFSVAASEVEHDEKENDIPGIQPEL